MSIFSKVKLKKPKRSTFDLSHTVLSTLDMGELIPNLCLDVLPGDTISGNLESYTRFAPMLAPVMHRINQRNDYFFIPDRILFEDCETFHTGGKDGNEQVMKPRFVMTVEDGYNENLITSGSLYDYLGFPTFDGPLNNDNRNQLLYIDAMPFLAYYKVWQYYYADRNLGDQFFVVDLDYKLSQGDIEFTPNSPKPSNAIIRELMKLRFRCWEKDYFTSALPTPQRGDDIRLPIQGSADVVLDESSKSFPRFNYYNEMNNPSPFGGGTVQTIPNKQTDVSGPIDASGSKGNAYLKLDPNGSLKADLTGATQTTIIEMRRAFALQRYAERKNVTGWTYFEYLLGIWGERNPDGRLQRPEWIGGGKNPVVIGEVLQTSQTTESDATQKGSPLGEMAGRGVASGTMTRFKRHFSEYGWLFCITSFIPRSSYAQGFPRKFTRMDPLDYGNPYLATIGEQEVKTSELWYDFGGNNRNDQTFGYQSRYAEYKYEPSTFHGDFRTNLNFWHLGRQFANPPSLNQSFLEVRPQETHRIFNVIDWDDDRIHHLWCQFYHNIKASRCLPYYGTPSL